MESVVLLPTLIRICAWLILHGRLSGARVKMGTDLAVKRRE